MGAIPPFKTHLSFKVGPDASARGGCFGLAAEQKKKRRVGVGGVGGGGLISFSILRAFNLKQLRYYGAADSRRSVAAGSNPINP